MPEISRFYGIAIRMFVEAGGTHHVAHFHASCQDEEAVYRIDRLERLAGSLPRQQDRLVLAWAELHQQELRENWNALQEGCPATRI